ncbi:hypothetical protein SteCoe_22684 [Stentor coeruleus]|uniref:Uncharacterized protein n=1 Tax=Stentor coeruleus TaxID=5963 RepID=A0A1R2BLL8_9CILI|nr:hypothetical protein SteCoe_22684 [Stentor coeruleus]
MKYTPPRKLQTTLLIESPRSLQGLSGSSWKLSDHSSKHYPAIVTPRDCTRTNSPIMIPSTIISENSENDEIKTIYEQLILIRDRHTTLKTYINSIRAQLQQSLNIAIAELQGKRNTLISQIDLLYDESFNKLCLSHKEKEAKITAKNQELDISLDELDRVIQKIELYSTDNESIEKDIQSTLKIWVSETEVSNDWAILNPPSFNYTITTGRCQKRHRDSSEVLDTTLNKKGCTRCNSSKKHRNHHHEKIPYKSSSKSRSYQDILRQNTEMAERLQKLENTVIKSFKPPRPNKFLESTFDLSKSESPISISTLYSEESDISSDDNRIRVYIPQGYPSYTCFYLIRTSGDINIGQVIEKLVLHMGMNKGNYCLKTDSSQGKSKTIENWRKADVFPAVKLFLHKDDE